MRPVQAFLITLAFAAGADELAAQTARYRGPLVDVHVHLSPGPELESRLKELDASRVAVAVASGHDSVLKAVARQRPGRVLPSVLLPCIKQMVGECYPSGAELPDPSWVRSELEARRYGAFGELLQQLAGMAPSDPKLEPYFALAEEFDVPVGIHMGLGPPGIQEACCPGFRTHLGKPHGLEEVLVRHPKLRVYVIHAGYPYVEEMLALLYMYPNVSVDIAAIALPAFVAPGAFHAYLRRFVDAGFHGRVMYGSDYGGASQATIDAIESARFLTLAQKRDIFCGNAVKFFRLTGVKCG